MPMQSESHWIIPDWPAPKNVRALTTTRNHPHATPDGRTFNLADHVGDDPDRVRQNREALNRLLELPTSPAWLQQVHGREVLELHQPLMQSLPADASFTGTKGLVCVVLTADCLPLLLCDEAGSIVAAVHAGWRGLQQNIIAATIQRMGIKPANLIAWLGPAISAPAYEVDEEVYRQFTGQNPDDAFQPTRPGHWNLDVYAIARQQLRAAGVIRVFGAEYCTYKQNELFFSYRRETQTGRMASLIWLAD
jgi:hypothetical protein